MCYYLSINLKEGEKMDRYKVVLLDESLVERTNYKEAFMKDGNFEIVGEATDGQKGLEIIERENPNLIVMDLVLESFDGFELLEKLKEKGVDAKIFVVSSLKNDGFIQKAVDLGASYYMVKPTISELLVKRSRELFENPVSERDLSIQKNARVRAIEEKLSNIFITIGIPAHIKGYQFLREAIKLAMKEPSIINSITGELYPSIASQFSTSASKVERAIRHAIEVAWNRGKIENINSIFGIQIYNANEKPTNGEFIALVADKMLFEGA